ncbi:4-(cytidine 5'-diphospho)-2-C-methyl-D-erythritol kinase [Flammeovirga kamogawensis]|uniref:4-diphosphocytidyl-2-C-methyl-D-erythritol kinase n=1 Tax=Flammeovirga kamogawensis TaxID=373891 RepID=A0ABX8GUX2_9BACT|nr:4-(cytidine 5'-diphospho)-2-C-methyl-D-erythritol kinase [Flammeovirga kamogawensis]MBB6459827.1 4-diphosphocytidyl-2-C-methyl-D-erythritol kinase [Flammeovirga kamogawensis]QWG07118.1 4-(cytidine 5'-diphospho)-2-C-methyl-D-erythritol kinase [Flammeovirga kamogawensis]TRX68939.1 4-(cytidine 5'-diphospho)-2-C-methyl-D-erythritol kinase [Flammeovirga kamogawensis]
MISFPNAKINIGLAITGKREDGFHDIASCFYPVEWTDILEIIPSDQLEFTSSGIEIPGSTEGNLCLQAYTILKQDFDIPPVKIHLHKVIPIGAGLGGGSADGAFALKMLNDLFKLSIADEQLEEYAGRMGSDCPFFIKNKPVWVTGRGELFDSIALDLSNKFIVLVNPSIHISTKEAYSGVNPQPLSFNLKDVLENDFNNWEGKVYNDFEHGLFKTYTVLPQLKDQLYNLGAKYASMTGSGSTVFGVFDQIPNLDCFKDYMVWSGKL